MFDSRREGERTDQAEEGDQLTDMHFEAGKNCCDRTDSCNPFIPGAAIGEDGALKLELWRLDRLGQYGSNCQHPLPSNTYLTWPASRLISN